MLSYPGWYDSWFQIHNSPLTWTPYLSSGEPISALVWTISILNDVIALLKGCLKANTETLGRYAWQRDGGQALKDLKIDTCPASQKLLAYMEKMFFTLEIVQNFTCPAAWGTRKYERTSGFFEPRVAYWPCIKSYVSRSS